MKILKFRETKIDGQICHMFKYNLKSGYPLHMIEKQIGKVLNKLHTPSDKEKPAIHTVPKAIVYFPTYFLGTPSSAVSSKLTQLLAEFYPQVSLRIVYTDGDTIRNRFPFKDKITKLCMPKCHI